MRVSVQVQITEFKDLWDFLKLKEHTLYKVKVKHTANNPEHMAFLFTGFKNGNYCEVYTNTYEMPVDVINVYSIKIVKELSKIK